MVHPELELAARRLVVGVALLAVLTVGAGTFATPASAEDGENVTLYAMADEEFEDADALEQAITDASLGPDEEVIIGETLVVAVDSERVAADLDGRNGTATERWFAALAEDLNFSVLQTNPTPHHNPKTFPLGPDNARVYRSGPTTYLAFDTGSVNVSYSPPLDWAHPPKLWPGERFAVRIGYRPDPDEHATFTVSADMSEFRRVPSVVAPERAGGTVRIHVEPEDFLEVWATHPNGTRLKAPVEAVPWSDHPGFRLDFRDAEPESEFNIDLYQDRYGVDRRQVTIREPEATLSSPRLRPIENDSEFHAKLVVTAEFTHPGWVHVLDGSGHSLDYSRVSPDDQTRLTIPLRYEDDGARIFDAETLVVRAERDNGVNVVPYSGNDTELRLDPDWSDWETPTPTPTPTPVETDTPPGTPSPTESSTPGEMATRSPDDAGPGFGPGGTFAALVGCGYLLERWRR